MRDLLDAVATDSIDDDIDSGSRAQRGEGNDDVKIQHTLDAPTRDRTAERYTARQRQHHPRESDQAD